MSVASARRPYRIFLLIFFAVVATDDRLKYRVLYFRSFFVGKKTAAEGGIVDRRAIYL